MKNKALSALIALVLGLALVLSLVSFALPAEPALAQQGDPEVCLVDVSPATGVFLTLPRPDDYKWMGLFHFTVDGEDGEGWCMNPYQGIGLYCFDATLHNATRETPWCEIAYILTNYNATSANEAAAIQLAIWKYVLGGRGSVNATDPVAVETRALQIYDVALNKTVISCNSTLTLEAQGPTTVVGDVASQNFTATIGNSGCLAGIEVNFSTTDGSFNCSEPTLNSTTVLTNAGGEASVTLCWNASETSFTAVVTAHTQGEWPVLIEPTELHNGKEIQETVISMPPCEKEAQLTWSPCTGSIEIKKLDNGEEPRLLGEACFNITPDPYNATSTEPLTVCDNDAHDAYNATDGVILLADVPPGSYNISEIQAPDGYVLDPSLKTVNVTCNTTPVSVNFTNTPCMGEIEIKKVDESGVVINMTGACFNISPNPYNPASQEPLNVCDNEADDAANTTDGVILLVNVPPGSYNISEVKAPEGYTLDTSVKTANVSCNTTMVTVNVHNCPCMGEIEIIKKDEATGELLGGACFNISPNPYNLTSQEPLNVCDNETGDANSTAGVILVVNVTCGNYTITETTAPEGYFKVTASKNVTVVYNETASANFTNTRCKGQIEIKKFEGRGCTPGYWKNHLADWPPTGYDPSQNVSSVFNVPACVDELAGDTLLTALNYGGGDGIVGAARILLRAGVAAVLNAAHPGVNYPHTVGEVVNVVNQALASCDRDTMLSRATDLDRDNNLWCPLGQQPDGQKLLGGACFNVSPDPYDGPDPLKVCDNDGTYDADSSDGIIRLKNVPCGNYTITEVTAPLGYIIVTGSQNVTVGQNETASVNFTNSKECMGCLEICKYEDKNGDGDRDWGEPWLSGWNFTVTDSHGHSWNVTTGYGPFSDGGMGCGDCDYCVTICDLAAGNYTITETVKDGWTCTTGNPITVTVDCDETEKVEFGNRGPCMGCLKIYKYEDKNGNGVCEPGWPDRERYLSGWEFTVTDSQGRSWTGTTNRYGYVSICDLPAGQYNVTETVKDGWTCTTGNPITVTVDCDETERVEFGNQQECTGCLKLCKYEDKNGNGGRDHREPGLSGWEFTVTDSQGHSWTGTTNRRGYVTICDLPAGQYNVTETLQDGWINTDPEDGSLRKPVTVECGEMITVEFGNQQLCTGCLKLCKYEDKNGDGNFDPWYPYYEQWLSGWEFTVTDSQGNSRTGTTNGYGYVKICNLVPGNYTITETVKDGWTCTTGNSITKEVRCGRTTTVDFGNKRECPPPCGAGAANESGNSTLTKVGDEGEMPLVTNASNNTNNITGTCPVAQNATDNVTDEDERRITESTNSTPTKVGDESDMSLVTNTTNITGACPVAQNATDEDERKIRQSSESN